MSQVRLVRIKRYNPHSGYPTEKFTHRVGSDFLKFNAHFPEWVRVSKAVADQLEEIRVHPNSPASPLLFEVETEDGAKTVEHREKAEREAKKRVLEPTVATAKDFTDIGADTGRGDLAFDDVVAGRKKALEASKTSAAGMVSPDADGEPESEQEPPAPKPKRKSVRPSKGKGKRSKK